MHISKRQLRFIIKEELCRLLREQIQTDPPDPEWTTWHLNPDEVYREHDTISALGVVDIKSAGSGGFIGNRNPKLEGLAKADALRKIHNNLEQYPEYSSDPSAPDPGLPSLDDLHSGGHSVTIGKPARGYEKGRLIDGVYYHTFTYGCKLGCTG